MRCICCNFEVQYMDPLDTKELEENVVFSSLKNHKAENQMWIDGIVANISAGYGSNQDGSMFVIAICDVCIKEKMEDGTIAYLGDYMFGQGGINKTIQDEYIEKYRKIWRRRNNLDYLSS